jgi:hypothetical protein
MEENTNTGVIAEAAVQSDTVQEQSRHESEEQVVPLSALQAERRERQQLQENLKLMQDHMSLLQANNQKTQQSQDDFNGLSDNDVLTVGEAKKFMQQFSRQQELQVEELKMAQTHKDYDEVVRKYLPEVLKTDPDLRDVITNAPNPYKAAYYLAKRSDSYLQEQRKQSRSPEAKQAVQNLNRAGNLSSTGSTASSSAASIYKNMSDKEFAELAYRNRGYI